MAINFPDSPTTGQVFQGWTYDGEKWVGTGAVAIGAVRYDIAQGLTANQQAQGRANIGSLKKNYLINGGMQISQENGATVLTALNSVYPVDMFAATSTFTGTWQVAQVASPTPAGSPNRIRLTVTAPDTGMTGSKYTIVFAGVEGLRLADLKCGTASAKQITVQFGVRAPQGTYCVSVQNGPSSNRSYVAEYVIAAGEANTDVVKSVTLTLDTAGTWVTNNTAGLFVNFCLGVGPTGQAAANSWAAGGFLGTSNQYNWFGTNGNVFELFDVSLTEGSVAPPFQLPDYATELTLCRRYFWRRVFPSGIQNIATIQAYSPTLAAGGLFMLAPEMRIAPAVSVSSSGHFAANTAGGGVASFSSLVFGATVDSVFLGTSTLAGGLVGGNAAVFYANFAGSWIQMSARL